MIGLPPVSCDGCNRTVTMVRVNDHDTQLPAGWVSVSVLVSVEPGSARGPKVSELCPKCVRKQLPEGLVP